MYRGAIRKFCVLWIAGSLKGGPHRYGGGERKLVRGYSIHVERQV